jgi:hypothetical protein
MAVFGTDPDNGDSDGDGFPDDIELASGSDPLDAESAVPPIAVPASGIASRLALMALLLGVALRARFGTPHR